MVPLEPARASGPETCPASPVRVLIAETHTLVRSGIRSLLDRVSEVEVVAETGKSRSLLGLVRQHQPQIVFFGVGVGPGGDWLAQMTRLVKEQPAVKIIMLASRHGEDYVVNLVRAGVSGFLLNNATLKELREAVVVVVAGGTYFCRALNRQAIKNQLKRARNQSGAKPGLTVRQQQILELIASGKTTKEIAFLLRLSAKTVETHRAHLMERLRIYNIPGLVRYSMRMGFTSMDH